MTNSGLKHQANRYLQTAPVTSFIVALCMAAWLVTAAQSLSLNHSYYGSSLASSWALFGPAVAAGDYARPVTAMFMHLDASHLVMNMFLLVFIGREVERFLGSGLYAVCYLAGGLGSGAAVLLENFDVPTVGASGALYALMALLVGVYRQRQMKLTAPVVLIAANVVYSLMTPGVSLWGHVGGLLTGIILLGAVSVPNKTARWILALAVLAATLFLLGLGAGLWG